MHHPVSRFNILKIMINDKKSNFKNWNKVFKIINRF